MDSSDVIKYIKDALELNRAQIMHIYELENFNITEDRVNSILQNKRKSNSANATYEELGVFLDGLIFYKRGVQKEPSEEEVILDNNLIIKKIRVALNLKEFELFIIFELADYKISKSTLKDIFRSPLHPKYKECTNPTLKAFLEGLNEFYFENSEELK